MRFLQKSKQYVRKRFMNVHPLEERQELASKEKRIPHPMPDIGAVVMLKGETKQKAQWKLSRILNKVIGKGETVRGLKLKLGTGYVVSTLYSWKSEVKTPL